MWVNLHHPARLKLAKESLQIKLQHSPTRCERRRGIARQTVERMHQELLQLVIFHLHRLAPINGQLRLLNTSIR